VRHKAECVLDRRHGRLEQRLVLGGDPIGIILPGPHLLAGVANIAILGHVHRAVDPLAGEDALDLGQGLGLGLADGQAPIDV